MDDLDAILNSMAKATGNIVTEASNEEKEISTTNKKRQRNEEEKERIEKIEKDAPGQIWNPFTEEKLPSFLVNGINNKRTDSLEMHPSIEISRQQAVRTLCGRIRSLGEELGLKLSNSAYETWQFTSKLIVQDDGDPLIPHANSDYSGLRDEFLKAGASKSAAERVCRTMTKEAERISRKFHKQYAGTVASISKKKKTRVQKGEELYILCYGSTSVKVNPNHYEKLKILYAKQCKRMDKAMRESDFENALFSLLLRYDSLDGGGFQAALNEECFDVLQKYFDCRMECFASPLNCRYGRFCSVFLDTDHAFGSVGSFFDFCPRKGCFEANPPFIPLLIKRMAEHMTKLLDASDEALCFIIIIPAWKETEGWQLLYHSRYHKKHMLLKQKDHGYCEGKQQIRPTRWRIASFDTSIFFLQNHKAAQKWQVSEEALRELRTAFNSKQAQERDALGLKRGGKRVKMTTHVV